MNVKRKGNDGEREILHLLHDAGFRAYRNDQRGRGGWMNPDVCLIAGGTEFHIEVKRQEKLNIWAALSQADFDAGSRIPLLVFRRNGGKWYITMELPEFLNRLKGGDGKNGRNTS